MFYSLITQRHLPSRHSLAAAAACVTTSQHLPLHLSSQSHSIAVKIATASSAITAAIMIISAVCSAVPLQTTLDLHQ